MHWRATRRKLGANCSRALSAFSQPPVGSEKAFTAASNYQLTIQAANERQRQYHTVEMPRFLEQLQQIEHVRLDAMRDLLTKLAHIDDSALKPRGVRLRTRILYSLLSGVVVSVLARECRRRLGRSRRRRATWIRRATLLTTSKPSCSNTARIRHLKRSSTICR